MTSPAARRRLPDPRWGWVIVAIGWVGAALAPVIFLHTGVQAAAVALASVVPIVLGSFLIASRGGERAGFLLFVFVIGLPTLVGGTDTSSEQLVYRVAGKTATCQVTSVRKEVRAVQIPRDNGQTQTTYDVYYMHTTVCPQTTYTIDRVPPYPVGTKAEVTYDPHGRVRPVFSDRLPEMRKTGLVILSIGAAAFLLAPFIGWALGRRRPTPASPSAPSYGAPAHGTPQPPAYAGRRTPPDPELRLQEALAMVDDVRATHGMSRIAKIMKFGLANNVRRRSQWPPQPPMGPPPGL